MNKNQKLRIIVILFIILLVFLIIVRISFDRKEQNSTSFKISTILEGVNTDTKANIKKYYTYGTHFNIEGTLEIPKISKISISKVNILLKSLNSVEKYIESDYTYKDNILSFSSSKNINEGIDLDKLDIGNYYLFVKIYFSNNEEKVYTLNNQSTCNNILYYTISKNSENNVITTEFDTYNNLPYMKLNVSKSDSVPDNIYDIVIDPGHGGTDKGATSYGKNEADIVLECSKILKQKLESSGYKVLLTRTTNEISSDTYSDKGRVSIANKSNAKLLISLHMNNMSPLFSKGGVEVYAPSNCNLKFAKSLADNIVNTAKTTYSTLNLHKKDDGVYVHNYSALEIQTAETSAKKNNYKPYNITKSTPYLYIIRETGGIVTNAFVDGRNKSYSPNKYINSNQGIESYSIDLGYMYIKKDLNNILAHNDLYMQAIYDSIQKRP